MSAENIDIEDVQANVEAALEEEFTPDEEIVDEEVVNEEPAEEEVEEEEQFSETELKAKEVGWNPEGKDRDGNTLSAEEYLARKPLFNKIHNLQDKLDAYEERYKGIEEKVGKLSEQNQQIAAAKIKEREDLMEQLQIAKDHALDNFDVKQVRAIDDKMDTVRQELAETPIVEATETVETKISPDYAAFEAENPWAKDTTSAMYAQSEIMAQNFIKANDGKVTDKQIYDHLHKEMRDLFPHKFEPSAPRTPRVGNNNQRQPIKPVVTKKTLKDIPEDQRAIAREVMEATGQSEDEYIAMYF